MDTHTFPVLIVSGIGKTCLMVTEKFTTGADSGRALGANMLTMLGFGFENIFEVQLACPGRE